VGEIKLIATDMDGTFLRTASEYDRARFGKVLAQLTEKGIVICAASGRQQLALDALFDGFAADMAFVAENGAFVSCRGAQIFASTFSRAELSALIEILRANPLMTEDKILLSGRSGTYVLRSSKPTYVAKVRRYYENVQLFDTLDEVNDDIFKLNTNFPPAQVKACEDWLNRAAPYVHATTTGFESIDIIPVGVDKATGLEKLVSFLGLTAENVLAFGDQMNDLEMLGYAGTALAMENAVPAIKKIADTVIGLNTDDAVLAEMEKFV
jgi:Cof subfamily protein (haloacid dehalogenase superfamily)